MRTDTLLVATDLGDAGARAQARAEALVADGGRILLAHVIAPSIPGVQPRLEAQAARVLGLQAERTPVREGVTLEPRLLLGDPRQALRALEEEAHPDLVLLGPRSRPSALSGILGSLASGLARRMERPHLVVRAEGGRPWRRVLVALDLGADAVMLVRAALALAPRAELMLLHVFDLGLELPLVLAGVDPDEAEAARHRVAAEAMAAIAGIAAEAGLAEADYIAMATEGHRLHEVLARQRSSDADLLVIGVREHGLLEHWTVGTVAEPLAASVDCDVLMVPLPRR